MKLAELKDPSVLILGLGQEGRSSWQYLRAAFPEKTLGLADQLSLEQLGQETRDRIARDSRLRLHVGPDYLSSLASYEVIVKSPGIPVVLPHYREAVEAGKRITSPTALCFANFPGTVIGVTGTKGKSTTASLIHAILQRSFSHTHLVGNIGVPPLGLLGQATSKTIFVYELSSHQLFGLQQSPPIAVLLNVVAEHLDYYASFEQYVAAKENITRNQSDADFLVYDADHAIPREIAARSRAERIACSLEEPQTRGSFLSGDRILYRAEPGEPETVLAIAEVPLLGRFNLKNVLAAVAVAKRMKVANEEIAEAVRHFQPLEHRLEWVGAYGGVRYYNDSIATVPEATIAALDTLGPEVETILLGGTDRHLDFSGLARRLLQSQLKTVILFPLTGQRIWEGVCEQATHPSALPRHFFVATMEEAVAIAQRHTAPGKICLHSPASPSFGLFRDYRDRGQQFKRLVRQTNPSRACPERNQGNRDGAG